MGMIVGKRFQDARGVLLYNNEFDMSSVRRMYIIENDTSLNQRGWQGHAIEKRWYACINGEFKISLIKVDDFENPSSNLPKIDYYLESNQGLNILYIEPGHISLIESLIEGSKLIVYSDYLLGENNDEYRFPQEKFF